MPYKLRKAPLKNLYWVVTIETGKKHSKDPISMEKAKAQLRVLESALKGGIAIRMSRNTNQHGEYEIRDMSGNLLVLAPNKQAAEHELTQWFKMTKFLALNQILINIDHFLREPLTPRNFKILDELITSYKNIADKFLAESNDEGEKTHVRKILNTQIAQYVQQAGHPNLSVETLGRGKKKHGGMMSVNPLVQPTPSPREVVLKAIQSKVDTANSIRATSITNPDGQKSMEKIMNEVALELAKAGKAAAVKYLNELREPLESRADFKTDDSVSRNKIAREIGLEIKGTGRNKKLSGGITPEDFDSLTSQYSTSVDEHPDDADELWQAYKAQIKDRLEGSQRDRQRDIIAYITLAIEEMKNQEFPRGDGTYTVSDPTWAKLLSLLFPDQALPNISERKGFVSGRGKEKRGSVRKRRGGMYSSSGPSPSTTLPNLRASVVQVANPLRQNEDEYNEDGVPHSERYLRNRRLGLLGVPNPLHRFNQTPVPTPAFTPTPAPAPAPAPVQITNPLRLTTQSVGFPGIAEAVQTGCSILGSCLGTGKKKRCNKCRKCGLPIRI